MIYSEAREDKFIADGDLAVGVLGAGEDFLLVDLSGASDRAAFDASVAEAKARGYIHCGFLRVKAGTPSALCVDPRGTLTMTFAAMAWMRSIADYFRHSEPTQCDAVDWLQRLYDLPSEVVH